MSNSFRNRVTLAMRDSRRREGNVEFLERQILVSRHASAISLRQEDADLHEAIAEYYRVRLSRLFRRFC